MNHYKFLVSICFFLFLFNCNEEQKTIYSDINITTENNAIVEVNIPEAIGNKEVSDKINSVIEKTVVSALHIGNPDEITSSSIEESITTFNDEFNMFKAEFPETAQIWEAQIDGEVMYQATEITSIAITSYTNTGGAHGILNITFLNFNSETGEHIPNNKIFNDVTGFKTVAEPYFKNATEDKTLPLDNDEFKLPTNIGYSEEGIILLYNTYEIAPYSTGIVEFAIPFDEAKPYLVFNSL